MIVFRIISGACLFQFGEAIGQVPILYKPLGEIQREIVESFGWTIRDVASVDEIEEETFISFSEDLFFTKSFFAQAIEAIKNTKTSLSFGLEDNEFNRRFILPAKKDTSDFTFDFKYFKKGTKVEHKLLSQELYEYAASIPAQVVKGGKYSMFQCDCFAAHILSPFHLLQVNMAMNLNRTISLQKGSLAKRFKNRKGRLGSFLFYRRLKSMNKIGKNCFIHPSAIIEGSIIGDNVKIGAGAIIRVSMIGEGSTISDNVVVANSVLGAKTFIANSNFIELCQSYESVFLIHGPYQFSIFGESSACFAVINCDFRLDQQTIKIPSSIGIIDSGQPLLGIAYGHRSKVGGGSIIAAGRIVPNDRHIYPPDSIHLKFEQ